MTDDPLAVLNIYLAVGQYDASEGLDRVSQRPLHSRPESLRGKPFEDDPSRSPRIDLMNLTTSARGLPL